MSWEDRKDDWTDRIDHDHPTMTGDYDTYVTATELVGNRHSKSALIGLVNHLLAEVKRKSTHDTGEQSN